MKLLILILPFLIFIACDNQEQDAPSIYVTALKNNLEWSGTPEIEFQGDTLFIWCIESKTDDELVFKIKFEGTGEYLLTNDMAYYHSTIGGDVLVGEYNIASGAAGELKILKYDEENRTIEGSFEVLLKKEWTNPESDIDFLDFKNGFFQGKISR